MQDGSFESQEEISVKEESNMDLVLQWIYGKICSRPELARSYAENAFGKPSLVLFVFCIFESEKV